MPRERPEPFAVGVSRLKHRWTVPFFAFDWVWEWVAYFLGHWNFLEVLDYLGSFSVLIAVLFYFSESGDRIKQKHYQAWQDHQHRPGKGWKRRQARRIAGVKLGPRSAGRSRCVRCIPSRNRSAEREALALQFQCRGHEEQRLSKRGFHRRELKLREFPREPASIRSVSRRDAGRGRFYGCESLGSRSCRSYFGRCRPARRKPEGHPLAGHIQHQGRERSRRN